MKSKTKTNFFRIRHSEVDRNAHIRLDSYFEYMQDTAAIHADELGIGLQMLNEHQMLWVLSRLKLSVLRNADVGETIAVTTWPSGMEKIFATREFEMRSLDKGDIVARASSCWLLLDAVKFRPVRHCSMLEEALPDNRDLPRFFTGLDKLERPEKGDWNVQTEVRESMIDANKHLNNARCTAILYDWLAKLTGTTPLIREMQINFIASTPVGTVLNTTGTLNGKEFLAETCSSGDAAPRFQVHGILQ